MRRKPLLGSSRPLIPGPYDTRNAADMVNSEWSALLKEIELSETLPEIKEYAMKLDKEWKKFYFDVSEGWWYAGLNSTYNKVEEYKTTMADLREKYIKTGGQTVTSRRPFERAEILDINVKPIKLGLFGWSILGGGLLFLMYKFNESRAKVTGAQSGLIRTKLGFPKSHKKGHY